MQVVVFYLLRQKQLTTVDREIFVVRNFLSVKFLSNFIFIARTHKQKLNVPKMNSRDNCRALESSADSSPYAICLINIHS